MKLGKENPFKVEKKKKFPTINPRGKRPQLNLVPFMA